MASNDDDGYLVGRSAAEAARLDEQNQQLIDVAGFTIHPSIKERMKKDPPGDDLLMAELATGTGAFLRSISQELPADTQLHGFDISPASFPQSSRLPPNVTLMTMDAKKPPSLEHQGRYDAVFIRYLNVAMWGDDWMKVAKTAFLMLKPGGSLQWYEGKFRQMSTPLQSSVTSTTSSFKEAFAMWLDPCPHMDLIFGNMEGILEGAGFQSVESTVRSTDRDPKWRFEHVHLMLGACENMMRTRMQAGGKPAPKDEESLNDLIARCQKDVDSGAYARYDVHVWTAVKPR